MFQIRIHGRGGQGVVSAAEMLAHAAFEEGRHAQAFPSFGSERMGAPVVAFCRIDREEIRLREPVMEPDVVIVQDPTLLGSIQVFSGLSPFGFFLINSSRSLEELGLAGLARNYLQGHVCSVAATELALAHIGRPLPNAALLGGLSGMTARPALGSVLAAIRHKFAGKVGDANAAAAQAAYESVMRSLGRETQHA